MKEEPGNNKGVWVVGNARSAGSFSATVKLLTATTNLAGVCAYASNYPPVGKYTATDKVEFTGTPMYEISLANSNKETITVESGSTFLLPCDYTLASFTDATGAPGIIKCIPMTGDIDFIVPSVSKNQQASFVVNSTIVIPNPALITYSWFAPDFNPDTYGGTTFTSTAPTMPGTYSVTLTAQAEDYCDLVKTKDVEVLDCIAPGSTVNFTAFSPCAAAPTGATWTLQDTRESNNNQNYKVKKMADGRIWMVQDLKFGDKCNKTTFTGSDGKDQTGNVTTLTDKTYYGDCRNNTQADAGYLYDWAAAIQKSGAYYGGSAVGCSGTASGTTDTAPGACQGICPSGWHLPTGNTNGEFYDLHSNYGRGCSTGNDNCWDANSDWKGVYGGWSEPGGSLSGQGSSAHYWSGTGYQNANAYKLLLVAEITMPGTYADLRYYGFTVRCVMNY